MLSHADTIDGLRLAKDRVSRLAWAFSLHLPNGLGGGAGVVDREAANIIDWIDNAITFLEQPSK